MSKPSQKRLSRGGYSLVEVLLGMVILSITLSSAYMLTVNTANLMIRNQRIAVAAALAEDKLEEIRNADIATVVTDYDPTRVDGLGNPGGDMWRIWIVEPDEPEPGMKAVYVYVLWPMPNTEYNWDFFLLSGVVAP